MSSSSTRSDQPHSARRVRVLHVVNSFAAANRGQLKIVTAIVDGLDRRRYEVEVLATNPGDELIDELRRRNIPCLQIDWPHGLRQPLAALNFFRLLGRERIDIVHQHVLSRAMPWITSMAGIKSVVHLHGAIDEGTGKQLSLRRLKHVHAVLATSEYVAQDIVAPIVRTAYPCVQLRNLPPAKSPGSTFTIGTAARLEPVKNLAGLLRAFSQLKSANCVLQIAGDGSERATLESRTRELGIADRVQFLGWRADIDSLLQQWDCFVLPSVEEGFGISVLEAMAAGLPVIATSVGGMREIVTNGQDGLLVPANDDGALADAMRRLISDPTLRSRLGANARKRSEHFSPERLAQTVDEVYRQLLPDAPNPTSS